MSVTIGQGTFAINGTPLEVCSARHRRKPRVGVFYRLQGADEWRTAATGFTLSACCSGFEKRICAFALGRKETVCGEGPALRPEWDPICDMEMWTDLRPMYCPYSGQPMD